MFRIPILAIFLCSLISFGYAQDSVKKAHSVVKPYSKYKTYKYHAYGYGYHRATKPDSVNGKPVMRQAYPIKQDTGAAKPIITDNSLNGQYHTVLPKFYNYQQPLLAILWRNVLDTLKVNRGALKDVKVQLAAQNKTIDSLKADVNTLTVANSKIGGVSLLGIFISLGAYNLIVWGLIIILGIIAAVTIIRSGSNSREARYRTKLYSELEDEFKAYKTKANDKEKKLARELQTERNKLDDLLGK